MKPSPQCTPGASVLRMHPSYLVGWLLMRTMFGSYFRWRVCNAQRVPLAGPLILAANHVSYLDPLLVGAGLPRELHYLARESLFRNPLLGALLRSWNVVPVDREGGGAAGLRAILDRLLAGGAIVLFPEGTRSPDGALRPARAGVGLTIIKSTCPVVPVRVFGTWAAFGRHRRFPLPRPVTVKFGSPLLFERLRDEGLQAARPRLKEIYQEAANTVMASIGQLEPCADQERFP